MSGDLFTWPPRPPGTASSPPIETKERSTGLWPRVASVACDVESEYLDLTSEPLVARLARAAQRGERGSGWRLDDGMAACWRCGRSIGAFESDEGGCGWCREMRLPWNGTVRLGAYEGLWAQAVREVKYSRFAQLGHDLGKLLGERVGRRLDDSGVDRRSMVVMPIPTHWSRRWIRGIDHPRVIAEGVAAGLSGRHGSSRARVPVVTALWRRARPSQTTLTAAERRSSVGHTMEMATRWRWGEGWRRLGGDKPPTIVLVDDVTTTGATLREACRAVKAGLRLVRSRSADHQIVVGVVAVTNERRETQQA